MSELKFQKEVIKSAQSLGWYAETNIDKFRKGKPDLMWKKTIVNRNGIYNNPHPVWAEAKFVNLNPNGRGLVHIETTELQKLDIRKRQNSGMCAGVIILVTVDKKAPRVYTIWDTEIESFQYEDVTTYFEPIGKNKWGNVWPMEQINKQFKKLQMLALQPNSSVESTDSTSSQ